ncbi:MAG: HEPN domain-containing protein [Alphaproteobacteria bacterium]|nr:HEPN domain-containing protein [Alphaproteobacteria bacterium]
MKDICISIAESSLDPGPPSQVKDWKRGDDGNFRPRYLMHSSVYLEELDDRESFQTCADQARNDPIVGPQLDQLVGTSVSRMRLTLDQIVRTLVGSMYSEDGRFEFDDDRFQREWGLIYHYLSAETFDYVTIAPLPHFAAQFPVDISPNIVIDRLTGEEVTRCVQVGILGPITPSFELIQEDLAVGLRCTEAVEKVVGKADSVSETGSFGRRGPADAITIVDDVLTALRLFKQGDVQCAGEVSGVKAWLLSAGHSYRIRAWRPLIFSNYELRDVEVEELQKMWSDLTAGTLDKRAILVMALRRFNMAFERRQLDDRIVDLMIAAESLFLHDVGAPGERGELRFRLALRAAKFVESPQYDPRQVFSLMRKAYDVRSQVVHGGSINNTGLPDNPGATLGELVAALEDAMRLGLRKALIDPQVGRTGYWEDLLFNNPIEDGQE